MEPLSAAILCLAIESLSTKGSLYELSPTNIKVACENTSALIASADSYGINPFIIAAIVWNESRWDVNAFDGSCCGIGQINPSFVPESCSELKKPKISLEVIPRILSTWSKQAPAGTKDKEVYMIACYAAGNICTKSSKAVKHANRIIKISKNYQDAYVKQLGNQEK